MREVIAATSNETHMIVLHLSEGVGLSLKDNNDGVQASATISGNRMDSDCFKAGTVKTEMKCDLIWEADRGSIKKIKAENIPIKLEFYSIKMHSGQIVKKLIGYILLQLRGIPMALRHKPLNFNPHWQKLIVTDAEYRVRAPEISLYLAITDHTHLDRNGDLIYDSVALNVRNRMIEDSSQMKTEQQANNSAYMQKTPKPDLELQLIAKEEIIQVGDTETECDMFIFELFLKNAKNLDNITNFENYGNKKIQLAYNLFGRTENCSVSPQEDGTFLIDAQITLRFRSSPASLGNYFKKSFYIPIDLLINDVTVGHIRFSFQHLMISESLKEFLKKCHDVDYTMKIDGEFNVQEMSELSPVIGKPSIEYVLTLQYHHLQLEKITNEADEDNQSLSLIELPSVLEGEQLFTTNKYPETKTHSNSNDIKSPERTMDLKRGTDFQVNNLSHSAAFVNPGKLPIPDAAHRLSPEKANIVELISKKLDNRSGKGIPRTFSFKLVLKTVKFRRKPDNGIWQVNLSHPKADTPSTLTNLKLAGIESNVIDFYDTELQLYLTSTAEDVLTLIESNSCILNIFGPREIQVSAELDNELIFVGTKQQKSGIILMEDRLGEKCAVAQISISLEDLGFNYNTQTQKHGRSISLPQTHMDENIAYNTIAEFEKWKYKQEEMFLIELKKREIDHLSKLSKEWEKMLTNEKAKLAEKLTECSHLTEALEEAYKTIKEEGSKHFERERLVEDTRSELEQSFALKLNEVKQKANEFQEEVNFSRIKENLRYRELEILKNALEKENSSLKTELEELRVKYNEIKQSSLPPDQFGGLFEDMKIVSDRNEELRSSKIFYKDQFAKTLRELHRLKIINFQKTAAQLKENPSLKLQEFLNIECMEIEAEREEIDFIKEALNNSHDAVSYE